MASHPTLGAPLPLLALPPDPLPMRRASRVPALKAHEAREARAHRRAQARKAPATPGLARHTLHFMTSAARLKVDDDERRAVVQHIQPGGEAAARVLESGGCGQRWACWRKPWAGWRGSSCWGTGG